LINDKAASGFIYGTSFIGVTLWAASALFLQPVEDPLIFFILLLFLLLTEYYPIPVWKGLTTLSFPLLYTMELLYGWGTSVFVYGAAVFAVLALNRRPFRVKMFNPSQLVISFFLAVTAADNILAAIGLDAGKSAFWHAELRMIGVTVLYFTFNNLIVDFVLLLRPQPYRFRHFLQKFLSESSVAAFSILYMSLMMLLGTQNRGEIDVFSYLFFFSPLVAIALISSFIARLQKERNRLKTLFSISTQLNENLPSKDWIKKMESSMTQFLEADAVILFLYDGEHWEISMNNGAFQREALLNREIENALITLNGLAHIDKKTDEGSWVFSFFQQQIKTAVAAPMVVEGEVSGVLLTGKTRAGSFSQDDIHSVATLANQLAVVNKTKILINEREHRVLLEERNRIAREIHDGIAQTLAGSVMQLETASRLLESKPEKTQQLMKTSTNKLRGSLKELRDSIYALRPYPTERIGLKQAIQSQLDLARKEHSLTINFHEKGNRKDLSSMVEKVIFDIFNESLQNTVKHAGAKHVEILLSYNEDFVVFKLKDDGTGFSLYEAIRKAQKEPHYGLLNMNELADSLGAALHIQSSPGKGTEIKLHIPNLEPKEAALHDINHDC
jgi:signal transduction histidine kinase